MPGQSRKTNRTCLLHSLLHCSLLAVLAWSASGCTVIKYGRETLITEPRHFATEKERRRVQEENRLLADSAFASILDCSDGTYSEDYYKGFVSGYAEHLEYGGDVAPPLVPPREYWNREYRSPAGRAAIEDWFYGHTHGFEYAHETVPRESMTVASSLYCPAIDLGKKSCDQLNSQELQSQGSLEELSPVAPKTENETLPPIIEAKPNEKSKSDSDSESKSKTDETQDKTQDELLPSDSEEVPIVPAPSKSLSHPTAKTSKIPLAANKASRRTAVRISESQVNAPVQPFDNSVESPAKNGTIELASAEIEAASEQPTVSPKRIEDDLATRSPSEQSLQHQSIQSESASAGPGYRPSVAFEQINTDKSSESRIPPQPDSPKELRQNTSAQADLPETDHLSFKQVEIRNRPRKLTIPKVIAATQIETRSGQAESQPEANATEANATPVGNQQTPPRFDVQTASFISEAASTPQLVQPDHRPVFPDRSILQQLRTKHIEPAPAKTQPKTAVTTEALPELHMTANSNGQVLSHERESRSFPMTAIPSKSPKSSTAESGESGIATEPDSTRRVNRPTSERLSSFEPLRPTVQTTGQLESQKITEQAFHRNAARTYPDSFPNSQYSFPQAVADRSIDLPPVEPDSSGQLQMMNSPAEPATKP